MKKSEYSRIKKKGLYAIKKDILFIVLGHTYGDMGNIFVPITYHQR